MQTPVPLVGFPPPQGGSPTLGRLTPTGGGGSGPGSALPTRGPARGKFTRQPPRSELERARRKAWGKQWGELVRAESEKILRGRQ